MMIMTPVTDSKASHRSRVRDGDTQEAAVH